MSTENKKPVIDPLENTFIGEVSIGFYRNNSTKKLTIGLKPKAVNEDDPDDMVIMALYTAAVQESLKVITKSLEATNLLKGIDYAIQKEKKEGKQ